MKAIHRRGFMALLAAGVVVVVTHHTGKTAAGDEQFQVLENGEFVDILFDDIVPNDVVRKARYPDSHFRVGRLFTKARPKAFEATPLT